MIEVHKNCKYSSENTANVLEFCSGCALFVYWPELSWFGFPEASLIPFKVPQIMVRPFLV
jgi:hypothetical protein